MSTWRTAENRPAAPDPTEMRRAMGAFATGVTVVTGYEADEPVGFACQSFASVSLVPPLVLFCADHRGRTWPRIHKTGQFCVNVLSEQQTDLCDRFGSSRGAKFAGLSWRLSRWGSPALPGVLLRVHAQVRDVHSAGDHDVVIGEVLELECPVDQQPMVFFRGGFGIAPDAVAPEAWDWGEGWA